jgi:hypothetical protein
LASSGFTWTKPPSAELIPGVLAYGDKVRVAIRAVADYMAQKVQGEMRQNAPWEDRTRLARGGLFSVVEEASGDLVTIWLSHGHTVYYGVFLELAHGKKYAVIMPTIEANLPVIEGMLKRVFA